MHKYSTLVIVPKLFLASIILSITLFYISFLSHMDMDHLDIFSFLFVLVSCSTLSETLLFK